MKKLFLNLNILGLFTVIGLNVVSCNKTYVRNYNVNEWKDFDLDYFVTNGLQMQDDEKKSLSEGSSLTKIVLWKIACIVFEKITSIKNPDTILRNMNYFSTQMFKTCGFISKQQFSFIIFIKKQNWEEVEKVFKWEASYKKELAQFGLENAKKYYEHIKNNEELEIVFEYKK